MSARQYSIHTIAEGFHFLEAPRWRDGNLYFSDFYGGTVFVLKSNGKVEPVCQVPKWVSGIGFTPNGEILVVSVIERKLLRFDTNGKLVEETDLSGLARYHCNDLLADEHGRAYVGNFGFDTGTERVCATDLIMVSPRGEASVAAGGLVFPNGMARTADGRTLIVAETFAARLSAFDVSKDGRLSGHRTWAALSDRQEFPTVNAALAAKVPLPDGIALDSEGALWIGDAGGRGALRVAPGGKILDRVSTPDMSVFAVAFGGPDLKTLYMCAAPPLNSHDPTSEKKSVLFATSVDVPGIRTT
jgi:sugar lactone lactonase YvrE